MIYGAGHKAPRARPVPDYSIPSFSCSPDWCTTSFFGITSTRPSPSLRTRGKVRVCKYRRRIRVGGTHGKWGSSFQTFSLRELLQASRVVTGDSRDTDLRPIGGGGARS